MLQPVLSPCESIDTDLSVFLNSDENKYFVYIGVALLETINTSAQFIYRKMFIGRLHNSGVKLKTLRERFGHDNRTIKKWAAGLKADNIDDMIEAFRGRDHLRKVTPDIERYISQQYFSRSIYGNNFRQVIIEKTHEVFGIRLCKSRISEVFKAAREAKENKNIVGVKESESSSTGQLEPLSPSTALATVQKTPIFQLPDFPGAGETILIRHAGLILFSLWMGDYTQMSQQVIMQLLCGAVNIEQSKGLCFDSLKRFSPGAKATLSTQRTTIKEESSPDEVLDLYRANDQLLNDGTTQGDVFFFDTHSKKCSTHDKVMKDWCGSSHAVEKVINMDSFHTISGRPCFIQNYSPYYDVRERFFMSLMLFNQLCGNNLSGRTFVIDRGIYGLATMLRFVADYLITWEKGYDGRGWDDNATSIEFTKTKKRNNYCDEKNYHFLCQEIVWHRSDKFRKIIVKATNNNGRQIMVSILCSNPDLKVELIVWYIFCRWLQENDFKYLAAYFGINQVDSQAKILVADIAEKLEDKEVVSKEYKQAKSEINASENKLAKCLLKQRKNTEKREKLKVEKMQVDARLTRAEANNSSQKLLTEIAKQHVSINRRITNANNIKEKLAGEEKKVSDSIEKRDAELIDMIHKESKIDMLIKGNYSIFDTKVKSYIDATRINASNMFRNLHKQFRRIRNNYRDDHFWLRELTRCSGLITTLDQKTIVELWLPGSFQPRIIKDMETLVNGYCSVYNKALDQDQNPLKIKLTQGVIKTQ